MENVRGVSPVRFHFEVIIQDDGNVRVASANPGEVSPYIIVGILEKVKSNILAALNKENVDDSKARPTEGPERSSTKSD